MDVNLSASDAKKRNLGEERGSATGIGPLPDSVLKHILSFLSTEDAVATSALSNRWIELWMSLTNLSFDDGVLINGAPADKRPHFMNFVERVLLFREPLPITKFFLCCRVLRDTARINSWISLAVKHKVQSLDLSLYKVEGLYVLPRSLFSCESLQELRLGMIGYLQLPKFGCLPKLKKLKLCYVGFPDDDTVHQLLSVFCPVLEDLELTLCKFDCVKSVCISSPLLKVLGISEYDHCCVASFLMNIVYMTRRHCLRHLSICLLPVEDLVIGDLSFLWSSLMPEAYLSPMKFSRLIVQLVYFPIYLCSTILATGHAGINICMLSVK